MYQAYGVLGFPLGHSLSPYLHNAAFENYGMKRCYFKWEIEPGQLPDFMKAVTLLPVWGVSVTIPYKEQIISHSDDISPAARDIGAVNTVFLEDGKLKGDNTDYLGFMAPLKGMNLMSALVLGAGGASRSILYGLRKLGVSKIFICNRNMEKAEKLALEFGIEVIDWSERSGINAEVLVNSTPLGTKGDNQDKTPWEFEHFPFKVVYDLVYNPLQTRLLRQAEEKGVQVISGLSMFVHQAREQFRIWTGENFSPDWAEDLLRKKLLENS
ncbi:MAG: shikimate dehydrogenase [Desulfonatronovibrio sp.]